MRKITEKILVGVFLSVFFLLPATSFAIGSLVPQNDVPCVGTDTFRGVYIGSSFVGANPQSIVPSSNPPWVVWGGFTCSTSVDLQADMVSASAPVGNYTFIMGDNSGGNVTEPWAYGYFYWNGVDVTSSLQNASTTSYIVEYVSPVVSPTGSTLVNFEFDYWNTGFEGFDKSGVEIRDVTAGYQYSPLESDIISVGNSTYSQNYTLTQGHGHLWRPYLRNSASSTVPYLYGNWVGMIDVVTDSASSTPAITESASTTAFSRFLNVPDLLKRKIPFSYVYEMQQIYANLDNATSSSVGSIVVDFSGSTTPSYLQSAFSNITLFSTSTVTSYLSPTLIALINALLVAVIWAGAGMHVYSMILNRVVKDTN